MLLQAAADAHELTAAGHGLDAELAFDPIWESLGAGDWAVKEQARPTYDAWVRAQVGVGRFGDGDGKPNRKDYREPGSAFLLVKHVNTATQAREHGNAGDAPTWGRAYTAAELQELERAFTATGVENGTALIRRGGGGIADAGSDANYVESHWVVEGGKIVGVRSVCKATQHEELYTCVVRFVAHSNGNFEKGTVETVEVWQLRHHFWTVYRPFSAPTYPTHTVRVPWSPYWLC